MDKKALRRNIAAQKKAMSPEGIARKSEALAQAFFATDYYQSAAAIYGYLPYNQEVRTVPILEKALQDGKRIAVPKVYGDCMKFIWLDDLSNIAPGSFGIPEPIADGPVADDPTALVMMPGLAFDPEGNRMGYGGGFYDRFLEKEPLHPTVALCYDFQMLTHLETEAHDIPVNLVLWA